MIRALGIFAAALIIGIGYLVLGLLVRNERL
jgi:hypothetical protein